MKDREDKSIKNKDKNSTNSKLLQLIDESELHGEEFYKSTQITTNYYYKK
ncbi:hypothetical protein [Clostridium brassicae]|uniref:Uncharacterized protein n=1 Tax=Clostridium brassicae TaxID=2999072 RepID=A0ABT4DEE0_9CLOT|nr:hypothetical protein [Clostridium brassicae]MCY6960685.1 hypothetical protein [Clostridium brassicae]